VRLATHYLLNARRDNGQALDPVAHFHLTNGARVERINWLADTSAKGLREAAGIMVNYLYQLDRIDANAEAYARDGTVDASAGVHGLLERPRGRAARLEFERVSKKLV
jgi:malonyl-CoA decarboxylase